MDVAYFIDIVNVEQVVVQGSIEALDQPAIDPGYSIDPFLEGSGEAIILESVENDDDKTKVIKGRRLTLGFNSTDANGTILSNNVDSFSDGDEGNFRTQLDLTGTFDSEIPFIGNLVLDDNTEAFQPRPNPVSLFSGEGLGALKEVELRYSDGATSDEDVIGHYRIIDYLSFCLNNIRVNFPIYVAMNLFEKIRFQKISANFNITATNVFRIPYAYLGFLEIGDTIEISGSTLGNNGSYTITDITEVAMVGVDIEVSTSTFVLETTEVYIFRSNGHTFSDIYLDALTFEKDVDSKEDCYTVLTKILDAFGCFITYNTGGWHIIRWDEYDVATTGIGYLKFANYIAGEFVSYSNISVDKIIAADYDVLHEGYRLSFDSAIKRFQRRAKTVTHTYNYATKKELPCNSAFIRGDVDDDVLPLKTYEIDCWTTLAGFGANAEAPTTEARIWRRFDDNGNESERYAVLTPPGVASERNYIVSEAIPITEKDKFVYSFDYSADSDNSEAGPYALAISAITLHGTDGSIWILGDNQSGPGTDIVPEWKLSNADHSVNADYFFWYISGSENLTDWNHYEIEAAAAPVDGDVFIHFFAANQLGLAIENFAIRYNNLRFEYIPFIDGTYGTLTGQSVTVTGDNNSRKNIEHEMFVGDSPKLLLKGALKKYDGVNYILTETWRYYHSPEVLPDSTLAKHIVFQWWNQFRETRTVIETDVQGITSLANIISSPPGSVPGMIHRWKIIHGDQEGKKFMLTSFKNMNFHTCGWSGVFVETSSADGDRIYTDDFEFKYLQ